MKIVKRDVNVSLTKVVCGPQGGPFILVNYPEACTDVDDVGKDLNSTSPMLIYIFLGAKKIDCLPTTNLQLTLKSNTMKNSVQN